MHQRLKAWIDPARLSPKQPLAGRVAIADLDSLRGLVLDGEGELVVSLSVSLKSGRPQLRGQIEGELALTCQRCLQPLVWPLQVEVAVELVSTDAEAARVSDDVEPCMLVDGRLMLRELVAEEILLSIPYSPRHGECGSAGS